MAEPQLASSLIRTLADRIEKSVNERVFGHKETIRLLFGAFVIGGHVLLEGPPGIAKTLLAKTFAAALGLGFKRIQFTPDLMPSDITGVSIFDPKNAEFRFIHGPVFSDIVLADEINRTPPKTQSALLEAMEEHQLTADGVAYKLSDLFYVIATQNPIEHEGTFPLPEAQLDRFLFKLVLGYPGAEFEESMIRTLSGALPAALSSGRGDVKSGAEMLSKTAAEVQATVTPEELRRARQALRSIVIAPAVSDYIVRIAAGTRNHPLVMMGASPRAALYLALASKLAAALEGRDYVIPDDVKRMTAATFNHRLILQPQAFDGSTSVLQIIDEVVKRVPQPKEVQP